MDVLVVGLGNPGRRYEHTRHNVGFDVADLLTRRWDLPRPKSKFGGLLTEGRIGPDRPRVAVLKPQTFMNEAGKAVGVVAGALGVGPERVVVVHDEIDLPFGEVRTRFGGGLAGHRGLRSVKTGLGSEEFHRVRVGVGRPTTTDPQDVASFVLARFSEDPDEVSDLTARAASETELLLDRTPAA